MERKILTRREFLKISTLTAVEVVLAGCKQSNEFVYRQNDPLGNIEVHLRNGESHPENGILIHNLKTGALENSGIPGLSVLIPPLFRANILYAKGPQLLQVQFTISRFNDKEPRDRFSINIMDDLDLPEPHQFSVTWFNWKIINATWDGMSLLPAKTATA